MALSLELPALYVEGQIDLHTIIQLLARHGIDLDKDTGPVIVKDTKGAQGVLGLMSTAAKASTRRPVGFIIDADLSVANRWQSVRDRLSDLGLDLPSAMPRDGYVSDSSLTESKIGVWIMPDNQTDEAQLEHLVQTLVPPKNALFTHACSATGDASTHGARFRQQDRVSAELHCWLAWQEQPGLSFGTALKVHYFRHDSDVANAFVAWFKSLFGIP